MKRIHSIAMLLIFSLFSIACLAIQPTENTLSPTESESLSVTSTVNNSVDSPQTETPVILPSEPPTSDTNAAIVTADDLDITLIEEAKEDEGNGWTNYTVAYAVTNKTDTGIYLGMADQESTVYTTLDAQYPVTVYRQGVFLPAKATTIGTPSYLPSLTFRIPTGAQPTKYELSLGAAFGIFSWNNLNNIVLVVDPSVTVQLELDGQDPSFEQIPSNSVIPSDASLPYKYTTDDGLFNVEISSLERVDGEIQGSLTVTNLSKTNNSDFFGPSIEILTDFGYGPYSILGLKLLSIGPGQTSNIKFSGPDYVPSDGIHLIITTTTDIYLGGIKAIVLDP